MSSITSFRRIGVAAGVLGTSIAASVVGFVPAASAAGSTVSPPSVPNTATAQTLVITDSSATVYSLAGGAVVALTGPGLTAAIDGTGTTIDTTAGTVTTTFDLADAGKAGGPALGPGAYTLSLGPSSTGPTGLDTVALTVTGPAPDVTGNKLAIEPSGDEKNTVIASAAGATFATGDAVSFTDSGNAAVAGLTFTSPVITSTTMTGDFAASSAVAAGSYNLIVTDTSGQKSTCADCVKVSSGPSEPTNLAASLTGALSAKLTWGPPADESTTFKGYSVVVSTSATATQTDSGITVTQPSDAATNPASTGATVTGLAPGTGYYVTVTATDTDGTSPAATASFATSYATTATFNSTKPQVVYGGSVKVGGQLIRITSEGDHPVAGATVYIVAKHTRTGKAQGFRKLTTNSNGDFSSTFAPSSNAFYAASYLGKTGTASNPGDLPTTSILQSIDVGPKVTITSRTKKTYHRAAFTVKGKVAPSAKGQKVYLVTVNALGDHKTLAYVTVGKGSTFSFHEAILRKKGTYHLEVQIKAHGKYAAGKSKPFTLKRT